jgi:hypothetical protein
MTASPRPPAHDAPASPGQAGLLIFSWLFVGLPLAWGVWQTLTKALALFQS